MVLEHSTSFDPDTFDIVTRAFKEDGDEEDFLNQLVTLFNNEQPTDPTMVNGMLKPTHYQEKQGLKALTNLAKAN